MEARVRVREHENREFSHETARMVADAVQGLAPILRPRISQVARTDGVVTVKNLVGSVRVSDGTVLEVEPKVPVDVAWPHAVVQLLDEKSRISVTGSQRSSRGDKRPDLTAVIAFEYARRLERAILREGPLQVFERQQYTSRRLNGRLDIGRYARNAWRDPTMFTVRRDDLTVANDFARGFSLVAHAFRSSVSDASLVSRLVRLESAVIPGHPLPGFINPSVGLRRMPVQWASYRPAWDIASAVLLNRSIINDPGHNVGLEVAVEPWLLLETLLQRTLKAAERQSGDLVSRVKRNYPLLKFEEETAGEVSPDGVLEDASGRVIATFEAKYTRSSSHPKEEHRYQALTAAAVLASPLAVLVYPGSDAMKLYDVEGFSGRPARLATVGLDMYSYEQESGDTSRASTILDLLAAARAGAESQ